MSAIRQLLISGAAALVAAAGGPAAVAHHSFAMFDATKSVKIEGTVKKFTWANPHVWIDMLVVNGDGQVEQWGIEGQNLGDLYRKGWTADSLKAGEKISVEIHPMKDGSHGGQLMEVTFSDGRVVGKDRVVR
jgi:Family of unknown function (DUF6152)